MMLRNTSEELLIRSLIDGSTTAAGSDNVGLGFLGSSAASYRVNSEELFNSWITNSEVPVRPSQTSRKVSTELAVLLAHDHSSQNESYAKSRANSMENRRLQQQDYPSLQTLSWFQSSQPMTRSRSTELRKRYMELQRQSGFSPASDSSNGFTRPIEQSMLPWPDNLQHQDSSVSTVVNMLKGTLEKKKLSVKNASSMHQQHQQRFQMQQQNGIPDFLFRQRQQVQQAAAALDVYNALTPLASESSGGGDNSRPATPSQLHLLQDQQTSRATSNGEVQIEEHHKRQAQLSRAGSITSSGRSLNVDTCSDVSTKKRRVERKRMMVEAKGRSSVPAIPSDMQAAIKRSETLEKEVRSLKLNLSFMNRKDSEQTKRIEELEKQNEELLREKARLTEELDQLIPTRTAW